MPLDKTEPSPIFHSKNSAFGEYPIILTGEPLCTTFGVIIIFTARVDVTSNCFSIVEILPYIFDTVSQTL